MSKRLSALVMACCLTGVLPVLAFVSRQAYSPASPPEAAGLSRCDRHERLSLAAELRTVPGVTSVDTGDPGTLAITVRVSATDRSALLSTARRLCRDLRTRHPASAPVPRLRVFSAAGEVGIDAAAPGDTLPTWRMTDGAHVLRSEDAPPRGRIPGTHGEEGHGTPCPYAG